MKLAQNVIKRSGFAVRPLVNNEEHYVEQYLTGWRSNNALYSYL
jgi:hypothetical protein